MSSVYRKIDVRIWNDAKFRSLSDDGQLALLFIFTHPSMTALGAMRATVEGLAAEKGWTTERFVDAIRHAISYGMVVANRDASFMGIPNFLKYNEPEGPNSVIKAWPRALEMIPECSEKSKLAARCLDYLLSRNSDFKAKVGPAIDAMRHAMQDAIGDAMRDASPIQEQEQEQEQEQKNTLVMVAPTGLPCASDLEKPKRTPPAKLPDLEHWVGMISQEWPRLHPDGNAAPYTPPSLIRKGIEAACKRLKATPEDVGYAAAAYWAEMAKRGNYVQGAKAFLNGPVSDFLEPGRVMAAASRAADLANALRSEVA